MKASPNDDSNYRNTSENREKPETQEPFNSVQPVTLSVAYRFDPRQFQLRRSFLLPFGLPVLALPLQGIPTAFPFHFVGLSEVGRRA